MNDTSTFDVSNRATLPRTRLVTASEVAAIIGISPWQTAYDVWTRKHSDVTTEETSAMRRGTASEDIVHAHYALRGHDGTPPLQLQDGLRYGDAPMQGPVEWAAASPDAFAQDWDGKWYLVEYKTSTQVWTGGIPPHYLAQVRWQLLCCPAAQYAVLFGVTGIPQDIADLLGSEEDVLRKAGQDCLHILLTSGAIRPQAYVIERNGDEEQALFVQVSAWYNEHIANGVAPQLTDRDLAVVQRTWMALGPTKELDLTNDAAAVEIARLAGDLAAADATAKVAEDAAKKARAEFLAMWAERYPQADVLRLSTGKVSYKSQAGRASIDADRLRKELPQVAAEYTKQGASFRTLRFSK